MEGDGPMSELGWSVGFHTTDMSPPQEYIDNKCRDVVRKDGGLSLRIQELCESHPNICWEYKPVESMLSHQLRPFPAHKLPPVCYQSTVYHIKNDPSAKQDFFFCYLCSPLSPWEFYVQPKAFDSFLVHVEAQLQHIYSEDTEPLPDDQIFEGVPCVVDWNNGHEHNPAWRRAKVLRWDPDADSLQVMLIDWGKTMFVDQHRDIKPLYAHLARLPPLALMCRMKDISINDLDADKMGRWRHLINEVDMQARIRLRSSKSPYHVDIHHPTIVGVDLAKQFLPPPLPPPKSPPPSVGSDSDDSDVSLPPRPAYVLRCERPLKPHRVIGATEMVVTHVASGHAIFGQSQSMLKTANELTSSLTIHMQNHSDSIANIPVRLMKVMEEVGCAFWLEQRHQWLRGVVLEFVDEGKGVVFIQSVDYGITYCITDLSLIKGLPSLFTFTISAQIWQVKLNGLCDVAPDLTSAKVLRRLMPTGTLIGAKLHDRKKSPPFRVDITVQDVDILDSVMKELNKDSHALTQEVVLYDDKVAQLRGLYWSKPSAVDNFVMTRKVVSNVHSKSRLQLGDI